MINTKTEIRPWLGLLVIGFLLALAGAAFVFLLWEGNAKSTLSRSWLATPCVIASAWLEEADGGRFAFKVRYEYSFRGNSYVGDRLRDLEKRTRLRESLEPWTRKYRAGDKTECFVNPDDPRQAVLQQGSRAAGYTLWFPGLFFVGGCGMIWRALRNRFRSRGSDAATKLKAG